MNFNLTIYKKLTILCLSFLVLAVATMTTASAKSCSVNCLSVYSIELTNLGTSVRGIVKLVDETGSGAGARGTVVHAVWARPDGSTFDQYANIGTRLRATFSLYTAGAPGTYTLTVVDATKAGYTFDPANNNSLSKSISIGDVSNQPPTAIPNADVLSGSAPLIVTFDSSQSNDADGVIAAYAWDFDDGNSSPDPNPVYTYNRAGSFTVNLTVTDDRGATNSQQLLITVTDTNSGCISNCMSVDRISLNYKKKSSIVKGLVWLVDENESGVRDAVVHATWTLPDNSVMDQYSKTGTRLRASFRIKAEIPGTYKLAIVEVTKSGYSFDPENSNVLNGIIDITP